MSVEAATTVYLLPAVGIPAICIAVLCYLVAHPDKAERVAGWGWALWSKVTHRMDAKAVKYRVAGAINSVLRTRETEWPEGLMEGDIRIEWADGEEAEARLDRGEVVVFMQSSEHQAENVTNALLAYLPRAVAPRARRYVAKDTMRAADLTLAKDLLAGIGGEDALKVLFDRHLDPAMARSGSLCDRLEHMDEVDVHGWLTRILLVELKRLADKVHPGRPSKAIVHEAEQFVDWLHKLAIRKHGSESESLYFEGRYLKVAIVFVAQRQRLEKHGVDPYRKTAKRYVYRENVDAVYLLARDDHGDAVRKVATELDHDGRVAGVELLHYDLRADFAARHALRRTTGVVARVTRRQARTDADAALDEMYEELDEERYILPTYEEPAGGHHPGFAATHSVTAETVVARAERDPDSSVQVRG